MSDQEADDLLRDFNEWVTKTFPEGFANGAIAITPDREPFLDFEEDGVRFRLARSDKGTIYLYGWRTANSDEILTNIAPDEPNLADQVRDGIQQYLRR